MKHLTTVNEETCVLCNAEATHKIGEVENDLIDLHPLTNYLCCEHFKLVVGDCDKYPYMTSMLISSEWVE